VNVFFVSMAAQDQLEFRSRHQLAHHVLHIVAHDTFGGGKITDPHPHDPTLNIRQSLIVAPLLDILAHRDILRLPVIGLHRAIKIISPLVFEREEIEGHGFATIDHLLSGKSGFGFGLIENEGLGADLKCFLHEKEWENALNLKGKVTVLTRISPKRTQSC